MKDALLKNLKEPIKVRGHHIDEMRRVIKYGFGWYEDDSRKKGYCEEFIRRTKKLYKYILKNPVRIKIIVGIDDLCRNSKCNWMSIRCKSEYNRDDRRSIKIFRLKKNHIYSSKDIVALIHKTHKKYSLHGK